MKIKFQTAATNIHDAIDSKIVTCEGCNYCDNSHPQCTNIATATYPGIGAVCDDHYTFFDEYLP